MIEGVPDNYVYLDWAATAPLGPEAREAMEPFIDIGMAGILAGGANANSLHTPGRVAFQALEQARRTVASCLGASRPAEVVFTSGATEADNAAILGISTAQAKARGLKPGSERPPHVIVSAIEHDAVLAPARALRSRGFKVTLLGCDASGYISPERLQAAMDQDIVLVSVQMANSEVGTVQPIAELAAVAHASGALMHTDAVQALGKVPVDVGVLGVDAASFSAHKILGPKGVGALYLKARTPFDACMLGGGQETGMRSGTQNVAGIVGFAAAVKACTENLEHESDRQRDLRDWLYEELGSNPGVKRTVDVPAGSKRFLPNIVHVLVPGFESETMVLRLDNEGFGVSGGSACSSKSLDPSHVLHAMGVPDDEAYSALRISFGRFTNDEDLQRFAQAFNRCFAHRE